MNPVTVIRGNGPVILAQPHSGTFIPAPITKKLNQLGRQLLDTDWHVPRLYEGLVKNITIVRANFSRYVIDANRDPDGKSLYPGQNTTELVPTTSFDGNPIWDEAPREDEISRRIVTFHQPYHHALRKEIDRIQSCHKGAVLYDCHSIRSEIGFLFDGILPDLNVGTNGGASCDPSISEAAIDACRGSSNYSHVLNGRFKGGWTTRHYGNPDRNIHAIQMELSQRIYLQSEHPPFAYDTEGAFALRQVLKQVLENVQTAFNSKRDLEN